MLFSVVIPTFNRVSLLQRTLASVEAQSFTDFEIIVVDDGSTDGTRDWLASQRPLLRVLEQANRGPGAARNLGAREARGDYVAFLDSDDLWFPWTLRVFAEAIERHNCPHVLGGQLVEFTDEVELRAVREEPCQTSWFSDYIASSRYPYYVGSGTCVLRREALTKARFLEDCLNGEDHDLILQMGVLPGFVRVIAPATLAWRRHPASATGDFASSAYGASAAVGPREGRRLSRRSRTSAGAAPHPRPAHPAHSAGLPSKRCIEGRLEALPIDVGLEYCVRTLEVCVGLPCPRSRLTHHPQAKSCYSPRIGNIPVKSCITI